MLSPSAQSKPFATVENPSEVFRIKAICSARTLSIVAAVSRARFFVLIQLLKFAAPFSETSRSCELTASTVTVGSGAFSPGNTIDNTASIDNPGGADATPQAPTRVYQQSQVVSSGDKILYLHGGGLLDRIPQEGIDTTGTVVAGTGTADWALSPALAANLVLTAGTIGVNLAMLTHG